MEVAMNIIVRKIGNSEGIIIPKEVLDRVGVRAGDSLELREEDGKIVLVYQDADLAEQLKAARIGMEKYKVALRELAK
jgi:putative addiction module antidote